MSDGRKKAKSTAPRARRARSKGDPSLLVRYEAGDHTGVWQELRAYKAISGAFREDALDVARATMRRVLHNADLLAERLHARGWISWSGALRTPPSREDFDAMEEIEATTGAPLPPSLRAFWEVVGGIDFVWDYQREELPPRLDRDLRVHPEPPETGLEWPLLDPLAVDPARAMIRVMEEWVDEYGEYGEESDDPAEPLRLELAPDYWHKANISGGPAYGVYVPFLGADPLFAEEENELPFVDYLRLCFRWGGFPRLARHADEPGVQEFLQRMTEGFQPI
jgi:hypothetical protein